MVPLRKGDGAVFSSLAMDTAHNSLLAKGGGTKILPLAKGELEGVKSCALADQPVAPSEAAGVVGIQHPT